MPPSNTLGLLTVFPIASMQLQVSTFSPHLRANGVAAPRVAGILPALFTDCTRFACLVLLLTLTGCTQPRLADRSTDDLLQRLPQIPQADRVRLALLDQLTSRTLTPAQHETLSRCLADILASPKNSPATRRRALQIATQHYPARAPAWLAHAYQPTPEPDLRAHILRHLTIQSHPHAVPPLLLALDHADHTHSTEAPAIAAALAASANLPLTEALTKHLRSNAPNRQRLAALACLRRRIGHLPTRHLILNTPHTDPFLATLHFWARRFDYLPTNMPRYFLCRHHQLNLTPDDFQRLADTAQHLARREAYRFDPRDTHLLLTLPPERLATPATQLSARIAARLSTRSHTKRPPSSPGAPDDYTEHFTGPNHPISYTDLVRVDLLLDTLALPDTPKQLQQFLRDDLADTSTEVGGLALLELENQRVCFRPYPPGDRARDNQYRESLDMFEDAANCLARWHCHAHRQRGPLLAGPGSDDLHYAQWSDSPMLVVTYLARNRCNVDYLNPEGAVIDLGNY